MSTEVIRTNHSRLHPGAVLDGKYRIVRELGRGGMGVVLEAEHQRLATRVAIKVMLPELAKEPDLVERFLREGRAAARVKSEHVARVIDVSSLDDGVPYMVMELLSGEDLGRKVERGPLRDIDALAYLVEACAGLADAHAAGLVHRDLKPENLFVTEGPRGATRVKVLDFGIAKNAAEANRMTQTSDSFGSPSYMSPEQIRGARDVDSRADIWALGVVAYELFTRRMPFEGTTVFEIGAKVLGEEPPHLRAARPDLPPAICDAVMACLAKERERRPPSAEVLAAALSPFLSGPARLEGTSSPARALAPAATPAPTLAGDHAPTLVDTRAATAITGPQPGSAGGIHKIGLLGILGSVAAAGVIVFALTRSHEKASPTAPKASVEAPPSPSAPPSSTAPSVPAAPASLTLAAPPSSGSTSPDAKPPSSPSSSVKAPGPSGKPTGATGSAPPATGSSKHFDRFGE